MGKGNLGSGAQLKVTPTELQSKSNSVSKISNSMKNEYASLKNIIDRTSGYWIGDGGNAHRSKFSEQNSDVDEMFHRIQEHVTDLQVMAGVYIDTEQSIVSQIQESLPADVII